MTVEYKYFLDGNNGDVCAFLSDGSQDSYITDDMKFITEEEADILRQPKLTHEQQIERAEAQKQAFIAEVAATIAPLQDAVDLDIATPEETSALKEWKTYRVMLNRVDTSLGADVVWPTRPA